MPGRLRRTSHRFAFRPVGTAGRVVSAQRSISTPPCPLGRAREGFLEADSPDPFGLPAASYARGAICVFVNSTCPICDESLPFYKGLAERVDRPSAEPLVVFVSMESESTIRTYLKDGGIEGARVASVPRPFGIPGTPCIVLIDRAGRVRRSWAGRLSLRQERDIEALVAGNGAQWRFP